VLFPAALPLPNLQPRPSFSSASTLVQPANVDLTSPRPSPLGALSKPKGKPGRPSREEIARRQAEAAAEGIVYAPQVRKRKPKKPKRRPLRSPLPRPSNTSADRATAVAVLPEEGHNVRNCTSEDSSSDREIFSDSNAEVTGHSDKHSDTSYDDGTTPPNHTEQSIISAVARRLVDGWVSQRQPSDVGEASNARTPANESHESQTASYPSKQNSLASPHAAYVSKRARDSDDADDQSRKRKRQNAKPAPDTADPLVRLLACPYQKHDPQRYSEANLAEKEYRRCASCYILDISRLKYVHIDDGGAPSRVKRNTDFSSGNIYIGYIADQTFTASAAIVSSTTATY
jgi:hypothetical protein